MFLFLILGFLENMKNLELRAYGFIANNLSDKAAGIQFGHAMVELSLMGDERYEEFARHHKTFILLKGGTTNKNPKYKGTLNQLYEEIVAIGACKVAPFYEPDLGDQMTAFTFIADERVFPNRYPDFELWLNIKYSLKTRCVLGNGELKYPNIEDEYPIYFEEYLEYIGGEKNYALKKILNKSKLF